MESANSKQAMLADSGPGSPDSARSKNLLLQAALLYLAGWLEGAVVVAVSGC